MGLTCFDGLSRFEKEFGTKSGNLIETSEREHLDYNNEICKRGRKNEVYQEMYRENPSRILSKFLAISDSCNVKIAADDSSQRDF